MFHSHLLIYPYLYQDWCFYSSWNETSAFFASDMGRVIICFIITVYWNTSRQDSYEIFTLHFTHLLYQVFCLHQDLQEWKQDCKLTHKIILTFDLHYRILTSKRMWNLIYWHLHYLFCFIFCHYVLWKSKITFINLNKLFIPNITDNFFIWDHLLTTNFWGGIRMLTWSV